MEPFPPNKSVKSIVASLLLLISTGVAQQNPISLTTDAAPVLTRAFPSVQLWNRETLIYLGVFNPDAVYHSKSRFNGTYEAQRSGAPASMLLSNERTMEALIPPMHAQAVLHYPSSVGELRNRFITYAYGRPAVLTAPRDITTDSQQRLIISDPNINAVHVLDPMGHTSFRIITGRGYRLLHPAGVAVDADDNIYVADSERGMIAVFDPNGSFLHYLGDYKGENEYESPQAIDIDRKAGRLYLVDTPRNLVFVLDLTGRVLRRVGIYHDGSGTGKFTDPTHIVVGHNHVYVLDNSGTRVQILDLQCAFQSSFDLPQGSDTRASRENGLGIDLEGNIYVSLSTSSLIKVYDQNGVLLTTFGQSGQRLGEFFAPKGLWIDHANRLYVADMGNARVQIFQLQRKELE
jgi:DNA-binding beta-propeller fold protein YncE